MSLTSYLHIVQKHKVPASPVLRRSISVALENRIYTSSGANQIVQPPPFLPQIFPFSLLLLSYIARCEIAYCMVVKRPP